MYFRDAAWASFAIGDHGLPIGMQVVMSIGATGCIVISLRIFCAICGTPATKAKNVVARYTAVKADALSIGTPEFVLIPLIRGLSGNDTALLVGSIE